MEDIVDKKLRIMDIQVGIEVQIEYMRLLAKIGKPLSTDKDIANAQHQLSLPDTTLLNKKKCLVKLAMLDKVEILRYLEQYAKDAAEDIRPFAQMAAFHSQLLIESALLGESPMVVASGMGGKNNCLRFFVALIPLAKKPLSETQKQLIQKEFSYVSHDYSASIEGDIDFLGKYPKFTMLAPFQTNPGQIVSESIKLCNELGTFLKNGAVISNVKCFDDKEVDNIWRGLNKRQLERD
ncbi:hypothetical protein FACS189452_06730 [Bacteroidia bacterium]|nr:hypothetical protein FACS189452_06730 [Bacteroidia bacterium]GHT81186.1 hypothetical protein FACS189467_4810 [Bacteroidia bacterium]